MVLMSTWLGPLHQSRAIRNLSVRIEDDPEPMVQQQLARLKFLQRHVGVRDARVLEFGCGSGLNCSWLEELGNVREVAGFDLLPEAVDLCRQSFPRIEFQVGDCCDPKLEIRPGTWDRVVCFEVLEHVSDTAALLDNIKRHLRAGGIAFLSTPNRPVFSLDHEPSPINREHIKELCLGELRSLLKGHFPSVEIYGQRFKRKALLEAWQADVRHKINELHAGTRWQRKERLSDRLRRVEVVERAYRNPLLRAGWRRLRWGLIAGLGTAFAAAKRAYSFQDFEFVSEDLSDSLWFCAILPC